MPFTFTHPAAILPATLLPKRYYSLTGLIAGSVAPDFEYFIRLSIKSDYSHTLVGIFWFNLPMALILTFLYHLIIKDQLIENMPRFFKSRFMVYQDFKWIEYFRRNWFVVIISVIIGSASHLLWDGFTHKSGYFLHIFPILANYITLFGIKIHVFNIVQHGSTLIGAGILMIYIHKLPYIKVNATRFNFSYWGMVVFITVLVIAFRFYIGLEKEQMNSVIVSGMSGGMLALILVPVMKKAKIYR